MPQKAGQKAKGIILLLGMVAFFSFQLMIVSAADQADFEEVLAPLTTIYNLVKYAATVVAGLVMLICRNNIHN
jgi:uncharacterized protein YciW